MASGNLIAQLLPHGSLPPATLMATLGAIADASTPASITPVLNFDGAAQNEHAEWVFQVPPWYSSNGFTFQNLRYAMDGTDGSDVQFEVRLLNVGTVAALTADLGMDTQSGTDITDTPNGAANVPDVAPTGAVTHANAGSPSPGDYMRARITRDYDHAVNADDARFMACDVVET